LVQDLIAALTNPSTRISDSEAEDDDPEEDDPSGHLREKQKAANDAACRKVELSLPELFVRVEKANPERVNIALALALLQHAALVTTIEPLQLRKYFTQVMAVAARRKIWSAEHSLVYAAYLIWGLQQRSAKVENAAMRTRHRLLRCGCEVSETSMPDLSALCNLLEACARLQLLKKKRSALFMRRVYRILPTIQPFQGRRRGMTWLVEGVQIFAFARPSQKYA
jgi:hypothetical protein